MATQRKRDLISASMLETPYRRACHALARNTTLISEAEKPETPSKQLGVYNALDEAHVQARNSGRQ